MADECLFCEEPAVFNDLCDYHAELEVEADSEEDVWPDFHDEYPGMWDESDLAGGWADAADLWDADGLYDSEEAPF
jgi:hypothetical protein